MPAPMTAFARTAIVAAGLVVASLASLVGVGGASRRT